MLRYATNILTLHKCSNDHCIILTDPALAKPYESMSDKHGYRRWNKVYNWRCLAQQAKDQIRARLCYRRGTCGIEYVRICDRGI
jgi:hypothetical protein